MYNDSERRQFIRIPLQVAVSYAFVSTETGAKFGDIFEGNTRNISSGGLLVECVLPGLENVGDLLIKRIVLAGEVHLPEDAEPVRFIGRVSWIEDVDEETFSCTLGVNFQELTQVDRDRINQFVIRTSMA